jgi:hypothetical protein
MRYGALVSATRNELAAAMPLGGVPQEQNPPNRVVSDIFLFLKFPWGLKDFVDV